MGLPSYRRMPTSELRGRAREARCLLADCRLCVRRCGCDRLGGERGWCRAGPGARISGYGPHFGEEPPLVGRRGSGTIFFSNCTMGCVYCQNYETSLEGRGEEIAAPDLAAVMLALQSAGCHNINLVSPTHCVPPILEAVAIASDGGLAVPLVYNTGTSDSPDALALLDGVVDIYMPDAKYADDRVALNLSGVPGYVGAMKQALVEMQRQVGDLACEDGIAVRGLIVRHLVLPGSCELMRFLAESVSRDAYVNIMDQYRVVRPLPDGGPAQRPYLRAINRRITLDEYREVLDCARCAGLHRFAP
ncbi:MAG: radical SAM protein [Methanospirillum sp.]|nr:radical SAM protein [Methanospirillum sp.]